MNNNKQFGAENLKRFHCIENPANLYKVNKQLIDELYGNYNNFLQEFQEHINFGDV